MSTEAQTLSSAFYQFNEKQLIDCLFEQQALNNNEFPVIPRTNFQHSHPHSISTGPPPAPPAPVVLQQQLDQHPHHLHHHPQEVQQQQHEVPVQVEKIWLCQNCTEPIRGGEVAIFAERAGSDKCWHPHCFSCSICHVSLIL